jgi:hypothetical protein
MLATTTTTITITTVIAACRSNSSTSIPALSTGKTTGACLGYVRDHIVPLCRGGTDSVSNMQWQTIAEAKAKDRWECK